VLQKFTGFKSYALFENNEIYPVQNERKTEDFFCFDFHKV
jgi:hypothetical protein